MEAPVENTQIILTEEQKEQVRDAFSDGRSPDLSALTRKVFNNQSLDGRKKEGRAIKEYISEFELGAIRVSSIKAKGLLSLSEEQKNLIKSKKGADNFSPLNLTREVFFNEALTSLSQEFRTVAAFLKALDEQDDAEKLKIDGDGTFKTLNYQSSIAEPRKLAREAYRPPFTICQTIARVNKYLNYDWKEENLKKIQIKQVESLLAYLRVFRFQYQINAYSKEEDRELFEDAFIRYTHDKEDLSQEELDQFITLSNEVVIAADIQRRIEYLRISLDTMAADSDGAKISMGLNEAINNAQTEYNQCISRQDKLYKSLTVNRSKRIEERRSENASVLNLVHAWKQQENREKMIALAERQRENLKTEVEKLSSIDEWKAIIRGLDPSEVFNT